MYDLEIPPDLLVTKYLVEKVSAIPAQGLLQCQLSITSSKEVQQYTLNRT
jgi:hypothetical protein